MKSLDKYNELYLQIIKEDASEAAPSTDASAETSTDGKITINVKGVRIPEGNAANLARWMKEDHDVDATFEMGNFDSKWELTGTVEGLKGALRDGWSMDKVFAPEEILDEESLAKLGLNGATSTEEDGGEEGSEGGEEGQGDGEETTEEDE